MTEDSEYEDKPVWLSGEVLKQIDENSRENESPNAYLIRTLGVEADEPDKWSEDEIKDLAEERFFELQRSM